MVAHAEKLKMLKKRPKFRHRSALDNVQFHVGPVVFAGNNPYFILNSKYELYLFISITTYIISMCIFNLLNFMYCTDICVLGTGYISIHGGITLLSTGEYCTVISGYWKYPREVEVHCDKDCDCVEKWYD